MGCQDALQDLQQGLGVPVSAKRQDLRAICRKNEGGGPCPVAEPFTLVRLGLAIHLHGNKPPTEKAHNRRFAVRGLRHLAARGTPLHPCSN